MGSLLLAQLATPNAKPVLLTTTDGLIEDQTSVALSADGKTLYYCTNAKDIERRHIWAVPVAGGTPRAGHDRRRHRDVAGAARVRQDARRRSAPTGRRRSRSACGRSAPAAAHARRRSSSRHRATASRSTRTSSRSLSSTKAADGLEIHNQLFLPKDLKPGERRPAIVFVHGGPRARCCSAITTCSSTTGPTASISGSPTRATSCCRSTTAAASATAARSARRRTPAARGNAEYQDVLAGGQVSAVAAGRRSGSRRHLGPVVRRRADGAGAGAQLGHLQGRRRPGGRPPLGQLARSRVGLVQVVGVGAIDGWKSPVLLVHGDDDRNVAFQQTTGLVQLLRAARRLLRAHRLPGRHARVDAAQPLDVHARPDGAVFQEVPRRGAEGDDGVGRVRVTGLVRLRHQIDRDIACSDGPSGA